MTSRSTRDNPEGSGTAWLSAQEMTAWRGYIETVVPLAAAFSDDLAVHGLTLGDYEVLAWLSEAPDASMRMSDLASRLRLSPSGVTRRLDGLVRSGAVVRETSTDDRRVTRACLTSHGRAVLEQAAPDHVASVRRHVLNHLTVDEIECLGSAFAKIREHLGHNTAVVTEEPTT